jgi:MFS family permease
VSAALARLDAAVRGPTQGGFRRFWVAVLVDSLGTWAALVALGLRTWDQTGSAAWVAALYVADFAPGAVIGLLLASWLDRIPPRRALVGGNLAGAACFALLALTDRPGAVIALAFVAGIAAGIVRPVAAATPPLLVVEDDLDAANGALGVADNAATVLGTGLAGVAVAAVGADAVLAANAVSFAIAAALLAAVVPASAGHGAEQAATSIRDRLTEGARVVIATRELRGVWAPWTVVAVAVGLTNALMVPLFRGELDAGDRAYGLLYALTVVGLLAGSMLGGRYATRLLPLYPVAIVLLGTGWVLTAASPNAALATLCLVALTTINGIVIVQNKSRSQRAAPRERRAGVFAFMIGSTSLAVAAGALAGGPLSDLVGVRGAWALAGLLVIVTAGPLAFALHPERPHDESGPPPGGRPRPTPQKI